MSPLQGPCLYYHYCPYYPCLYHCYYPCLAGPRLAGDCLVSLVSLVSRVSLVTCLPLAGARRPDRAPIARTNPNHNPTPTPTPTPAPYP